MGIYILGTQYNPKQSGIAWTQPGGPYTTVYPQEQINVPFSAYPVPGQLFAENSGIWVAACGHWMDEPMIFFDYAAFILTATYLEDSLGRIWLVGVSNGGIQLTATQVTPPKPISVVLLSDLVTSQTWQLTVFPNADGSDVDYQITAVGGSGGIPQLLVLSPDGDLYGIQVSGGVLETAYAMASMSQGTALVTCNLCTLIQYAMPIATFYNTFLDPQTII